MYLAWIDVAQRYKRSKIGPFWLTLQNAIVTLALSVIWANLFNAKIGEFMPYFAVSYVIWGFIATTIGESASTLITYENLIKQIKIPTASLFLRVIARNLIILLHLAPIPILIFIAFPTGWSAGYIGVIYSIFGFVILSIFMLFFCMILGVACAKYRDLVQATVSILQLIFLSTPILWNKNLLESREYLYEFNPFFHLIEIVRAPILYNQLPLVSIMVISFLTLLLVFLWFAIHKKYGRLIVYWL